MPKPLLHAGKRGIRGRNYATRRKAHASPDERSIAWHDRRAATTAFYARFVERARVRLDRFTVPVDKPGIPPQGLIILHLSDLHLRENGVIQARKLDSLRRALAGEQYDLVALTGDLIHDQPGLATALSLIGELRPRLGGYSCLGNHDYWESSLWGIFGKRADDAGPWRPADVSRRRANCGHSWVRCCATSGSMRGWRPTMFRP